MEHTTNKDIIDIPQSVSEITGNMKHDLVEAAEDFTSYFSRKIADKDSPLTIENIEYMMKDFMSKTQKLSLDAVSSLLSNFDEKEIISLKKLSSQKEG